MRFIVNIVFVEENRDTAARRVEDYIRSAVGHWGGQFHPEDGLFPRNIKKVTVKPIKEIA